MGTAVLNTMISSVILIAVVVVIDSSVYYLDDTRMRLVKKFYSTRLGSFLEDHEALWESIRFVMKIMVAIVIFILAIRITTYVILN